MWINTYKTYISEIPIQKRVTIDKTDMIAILPIIEDAPQILIRSRRELDLRRTIMKVKAKIISEPPDKSKEVLRDMLKQKNIEDLTNMLEDYIITIRMLKSFAKINIGRVIELNSGTDVWNVASRGRLTVDIYVLRKFLKNMNIIVQI
ncbi:MAG: hypothetical protein GXO23_03855 [Crenarchaeota archaeon]|nr:hypothetical protein [Thermoproteota archaeon]